MLREIFLKKTAQFFPWRRYFQGSCHQSQTCSCCFTIGVPEMNRDWLKKWGAAAEYAEQRKDCNKQLIILKDKRHWKICSHVGHPSAKDILSPKAYRFVVVGIIIQSGKPFGKMACTKKNEKRSLVIVTARIKARKCKTLIRKVWAITRQKEHPASYHITTRDWIYNRLQ